MIAVGRQRAVRFLCGLPSAGRLGALSADRQALREKRNPRNSAGQAPSPLVKSQSQRITGGSCPNCGFALSAAADG